MDSKSNFTWIPFYEEMADKLLEYKDRRDELLNIIYSLPKSLTKYLSHNGERFFDIDPFSVFAMFNRGNLKAETRERYLMHFKERLGIEAEIPQDYDGLPVMYFIQAFFLNPNRTDDINVLWDLYEAVVNGGEYQNCLTQALSIKNIGDPITFGMFWVRPRAFISLDKNNREYLSKRGVDVLEKYDGNDYSLLLKKIKDKQKAGEIEDSFALLSHNAWIEANRKIKFSSVEQLVDTYLEYYKTHGGLDGMNELYKWKIIRNGSGFPKEDSSEFIAELDRLKPDNLVYQNQPDSFKTLAKYKPNEFYDAVKHLVDDNNELQQRTVKFCNTCKQLWKEVEPLLEKKKTGQFDERLASFFLMLRHPQKYTPYMSKVYDLLCELTGEKQRGSKQKLAHFYEILNEKVIPIVEAKTELTDLAKKELSEAGYDYSLPLLSQTVLWFANQIKEGKVKFEIKETKKTMTNDSIKKYIQLLKQKKNIILQGAPGTGKTYTTAEIAVAICDDEFKDFSDHSKVMDRYEALQKEHRIEFCTFHQSMDYEDFVEGLKPIVSEDGKGITYKTDDGIFKRISDNARRIITKQTNKEIDFDNVRVFKMSLGEVASEDGQTIYDYCLENNVVCLGWGGNTDFSDCQKREDFKAKCNDWGAVALEIFKTWMQVGDIIVISNGNKKFRAIARITGEYNYNPEPEIGICQFRDVEWLYKGDDIPVEKIMDKQFSQQSIYGLYAMVKGVVKNSVNTDFINSIVTGKVEQSHENYVLIIDEINRGNVSKIFGELITLLEADKRTGEKNTEHPITVKLPYSKEPFSVPDNLYIIGTMNTTDRSTGTIDYAVRRRFAFITLEAKRDKVNENARGLFDEVQKFIEDRRADENFDMSDLMVGHSYFMTAKGEDIKLKMEYEVIPLIKEYIKDRILTTKKGEDDEYFKSWKKGETFQNQKSETVKAADTE